MTIKQYLITLRTYGNKPALIDASTKEQVTYAELTKRIEMRAACLRALAIKPGERVMLVDIGGIEWVEYFFACLGLGIVAVPVDNRMQDAMIERACTLTKPRYIIIPADTKRTRRSEMIHIPAKRSRYNLEKWPDIAADAPAEIVFTSGTWADPKGVTLSHGNVLSNLDAVKAVITSGPNDTLLSILPLSHCYEQMAGLLVPLAAGSSIVYLSTLTGARITDSIKEYQISIIVAVPRIAELLQKGIVRKIPSPLQGVFVAIIQLLAYVPRPIERTIFRSIRGKIGPSLDMLIIGGAALPHSQDRFFTGLGYRIVVGYGLSEAAPVLSVSTAKRRSSGEVGKALPGITLEVNESGELIARGPNIFLGYWPDIYDNSQQRLQTGDLAAVSRRGTVTILGRSKNLLVYPSGDKLFLEDIEAIACRLAGVDDCCASNMGDDSSVEVGIVYTGTAPESEIHKLLVKTLPAFAFIKRVQRVDAEIPRTHTLKPNRKYVRELLLASAQKP